MEAIIFSATERYFAGAMIYFMNGSVSMGAVRYSITASTEVTPVRVSSILLKLPSVFPEM